MKLRAANLMAVNLCLSMAQCSLSFEMHVGPLESLQNELISPGLSNLPVMNPHFEHSITLIDFFFNPETEDNFNKIVFYVLMHLI